MKSIGKKIRELRIKNGLTQVQLAELVGVQQSHISSIEKGKSNVGYSLLEKIAKAFNVNIAYFFDGTNVMPMNSPTVLSHLDEELKDFVLNNKSIPYLVFARNLAFHGWTKEELEMLSKLLLKKK